MGHPTHCISVSNQSTRYTTVSVTPEMRDMLRAQKRGGQTYSELIESMVAQYEPEENN
jgi:cytochrome c-type biogenesis protein CcmH/NrfF